MKYYTKLEDVPSDLLESVNKLQWPDGREPTEQEKLEALNNVQKLVEHIFDRWYGTGQYDRPDYDAAKFRAEQTARHAAADKMTPQEFYDEAYADWMQRNGKWHTKQYGIEATEAKCKEQATLTMRRELESRERWREYKAKFEEEKPTGKRKKGNRIKLQNESAGDPNRYGSKAYIESEKDPEVLYKDAYDYWMRMYKTYLKKEISEKTLEFKCREHAERAVIRAIEEKEARAELEKHRKPEKPKKYSY
ncbi:MAG: hypothetical protein SFW64_06755 [Alphaproteobacteria bacterium]|nr:hypothetical protein [Alphaproteobacteria bacterium]